LYGGFVDKVPMGSAINRGLTFRMAQIPAQHYLPKRMERIEKGNIDPFFVITHRIWQSRSTEASKSWLKPWPVGRTSIGRAGTTSPCR
jgi:threonine dehydrogenase-like Zn-dependent dehydrogenase